MPMWIEWCIICSTKCGEDVEEGEKVSFAASFLDGILHGQGYLGSLDHIDQKVALLNRICF